MTVIFSNTLAVTPGGVPLLYLPIRAPAHLSGHQAKEKPRAAFFWVWVLLWVGGVGGGGDGLGADLLNARPVRSRSGTGWVLRVRYFFFLSCQQDSDRTLFWGLCSLRGKALSFLFLHSVHSPEGQPSVLWRTASEDFSQED